MIEEFKKSIQSTLYERMTSPLSGAFILSWIVWNWKLIYYLFYSENGIPFQRKIEFIQNNFINIYPNLIFPVITSVFFVVVYPLFTTGALWIWFKYKKWQQDIRNDIEKTQLLSLEQSIELRFELRNQQTKFEELLKSKNAEIEVLKGEIKLYSAKSEPKDKTRNDIDYSNEFNEFDILLHNDELMGWFDYIIEKIQKGSSFVDSENPTNLLTLLESFNIIERPDYKLEFYKLTDKGKRFIKYNSNRIQNS